MSPHLIGDCEIAILIRPVGLGVVEEDERALIDDCIDLVIAFASFDRTVF